ncbi:MAG TPA: lipoyl(octanoyl) transferase LipB [Hyphomicrobiales bacterium]|nr:lipoyl(octanoyl) transferase LipB [Hyphomicrobiales bacterium]
MVDAPMMLRSGPPPEWRASEGRVPYPAAVAAMEARVAAIRVGEAPELVWLVEHPPLYTAGTGARDADLIDPAALPVFRSGRGGQFTYHGPGQRVVYLMLDLKRRMPDVRAYVEALERWLVAALGAFNVAAVARPAPRVGVWVPRPEKGRGAEDKIGAIGVRVRGWVTYHGVSLNVEPDLGHYAGIVPCGISDGGVTSLVDLGRPVTMAEADAALLAAFPAVFGPVEPAAGEPPELLAEAVLQRP